MINIAPQNAASTKVAVTNTATGLYALMNTAGSVQNSQKYYTDERANAVSITPEDGDVRMLFGGTPTAALGELLKQGTKYYFPGVQPGQMTLIRTGAANVNCSVNLYVAKQGESPTAVSDPANAGTESGVYAEDTASAGGDNAVAQLTVREDTPATNTSADGDYQFQKGDAKGYTWTREGYAPKYEDGTAERAIIGNKPTIDSNYTQSNKIFDGSAATINIKATAGVLGGLDLYNAGAAKLFIMFFNDANTASNAQVPDLGPFTLPAGTGRNIGAEYFMAKQQHFTTGIAVGISTTVGSYTAYGTPSEITGSFSYS